MLTKILQMQILNDFTKLKFYAIITCIDFNNVTKQKHRHSTYGLLRGFS